ncbi:MAG: rod shape-determining protein RodA [Kiritimatiellia bacterium]|nr:rod shape-determining protein RodA [Kiritimatiellia bacterium]
MNLRRLRSQFWRLDFWTLTATLALAGIGMAFIYSAGYRGEDQPVSPFFSRQIVWTAVGLSCLVFVAMSDYRAIGEQAGWLYLFGVVLLVLVLLVGVKVYGAYRWLNFFGIRVQPSEFGKLAAILLLARYLARPDVDPQRPACIFGAALIAGPGFILILVEPDLGSALMLVPVAVAMLFAAGIPFRSLGIMALGGLVTAPFGWFALGDYQRERVLVFLDPSRDPLGSGWNKIQSAIAVGSGGWSGKGFCEGAQNVLGFLPRTVAPTDFIFSVIAEETGFVGSMAVLGLFALVFLGGIRAAIRAPDKFGQILATGLTTLLFAHVFVNIAMTIGLLPITGLPLPLISYGGSFMVATMLALGLLQSVYVRRYTP